MPLVTRTANAANVYSQAAAPTIIQDGEVWIDTDTGAVYTSENGAWVAQSSGAIGTARQQIAVNSGATALEYVASLQSLMTAQGDIVYASAANTPARLAKGTGGQTLKMNTGATAPEWGSGGIVEVLDNHLASGTEADYTFTPAVALSGDTYSKIIVDIDGESSATLALQAVINGVVGTSNVSYGIQTTASAVSYVGQAAGAQIMLGSTALLGAALEFAGTLTIYLVQTAGRPRMLCESSMNSAEIAQHVYHNIVDTSDTVASIKIKTSTSTWKAGTRITTFGVKRA